MIFSYFNYLLYINSSFTLNLKTAISKHSKDELILNSGFFRSGGFLQYDCAAPPPRKPKGKPTIENHVRFLETHLIEGLKENIFTSLDSLNKETQKIIAAINQADFRNKNDIRRTREYAFQTYDKPKMKPLPSAALRLAIINIFCVYQIITTLNMTATITLYCIRITENLQCSKLQ